jgi:hypothetical protein
MEISLIVPPSRVYCVSNPELPHKLQLHFQVTSETTGPEKPKGNGGTSGAQQTEQDDRKVTVELLVHNKLNWIAER